MTDILKGKSILITGGTGSFGKEFVDTILRNHKPRRVIVFSRDELKQFEMSRDPRFLNQSALRYFIGDVRDKDRLLQAFRDVDYVIHAAALKQVPACEYNPFEAVKTNVIGAQNIIDVAIERGVEKVVALSTDKACNPLNLYGATKLCSDKLFVAGNTYAGATTTRFSVVRYGNVVGSRGSVIPLFIRMRKTGTLTITDERMTRFWITLDQGVDLVMKTLIGMHGGEIFVPKIPSMNMVDLAKAMGPDCDIKFIGIRPGEKLHEIMIAEDDARHVVEFDEHYIIKPDFPQWRDEAPSYSGGKGVPEGFSYSSDNNTQWVTTDELKEMIRPFEAEYAQSKEG